MKAIVRSVLLSLMFTGIGGSAYAQIRDDESSQAVLAVQCAVSSGFSASEFEEYSRRLAKTLSLLTSSQQKKVFGYLPQPAAVSSNNEDSAPITVSPDRDEKKESDPGLLVGLVGDFNNAMSGTDPESSGVYAGKPETVGSAVSAVVRGKDPEELQVAAKAIASTKKSGNSWDAIVSWLTSLAQKARQR